jgi:tetratricopeptide (TPR) repeat protein
LTAQTARPHGCAIQMGRRTKNQIAGRKNAAIQRAGGRDRWPLLGVCVFLVALTWIVFGQTVHFEFINFDDGDYVFRNPEVARGLTPAGIAWAFTGSHAANWFPLTWISHMLDCQLYGLNPGGHHVTNVLLHAASVVLLFLVLERMTGALWRSAFVASLFAIHPLRVESVAWVSERKDVLSGLFFMLIIGAYERYARSSWSAGRYALVLILFACGLMSKPMLVTVPFVLLLLDYWPLNRFAPAQEGGGKVFFRIPRQLIVEKIPLFGLSLASCVITVFAQTAALRPLTRIPLLSRIGNAVVAYKDYVLQMLWPSNLAVFYPWEAARIGSASILLSAILLLGISAGVLLARQRRYLITGWLWYLIMLGPVIGILQVGNQARADRYTYLPQIGLYILLTWTAADFCLQWRHRRLLLSMLSVIILTGLAIAARIQAASWQNSESLWSRALSRTSDNVVAELNLGEAIYKLGRMTEAIAHFERVLRIEPNEPMAHASLGAALLKTGQTNAALAHLQKSLEIDPKQPSAHSSLGVLLLELGRLEESRSHLQTALAIDPENSEAHYNLGNVFLQMGQANEAVAEYGRALRINPDDIEALNNTAWILATCPDPQIRNGAQAVALAERADSLTLGKSPVIGATLAAAYAESGRFAEAVKSGQRALQLANLEGNMARADSIRAQIELYQSGAAFRDHRYASIPR